MAGILPDVAKASLSIPDGWEAVTGVAIGYLGDPNSLSEKLRERELTPSPRKPISQFAFAGSWGKPI
jgi:hypothetical protein